MFSYGVELWTEKACKSVSVVQMWGEWSCILCCWENTLQMLETFEGRLRDCALLYETVQWWLNVTNERQKVQCCAISCDLCNAFWACACSTCIHMQHLSYVICSRSGNFTSMHVLNPYGTAGEVEYMGKLDLTYVAVQYSFLIFEEGERWIPHTLMVSK